MLAETTAEQTHSLTEHALFSDPLLYQRLLTLDMLAHQVEQLSLLDRSIVVKQRLLEQQALRYRVWNTRSTQI